MHLLPLTPGDLIHSAMRSNTEIVHSFCGGCSVNRCFCYLFKICINTYLMLCKYTQAVLFTLPPFYLPFPSMSGEFIVYFVQYSYVFSEFVLSLIWSRGVRMSDCLWRYLFPW